MPTSGNQTSRHEGAPRREQGPEITRGVPKKGKPAVSGGFREWAVLGSNQ
jgi:hypothetical protein